MNCENVDVGAGDTLSSLGAASRRHSWHRRAMQQLGMPLLLLALCSGHPAHAASTALPEAAEQDVTQAPKKSDESRLWMTVGERRFAITLVDNEATRAFAATLPLTLDMEDLHGNEKKKNCMTRCPPVKAGPARSATETLCFGDRAPWSSFTRPSTQLTHTPVWAA